MSSVFCSISCALADPVAGLFKLFEKAVSHPKINKLIEGLTKATSEEETPQVPAPDKPVE